jgi:ABC-type phosphate transport system permease subunit
MTKAQKVIIAAAAALSIAAILYPPYIFFTISPDTEPPQWRLTHSGWTWITAMGPSNEIFNGRYSFVYRKIGYGMLSMEIFGTLVLAGAALVIARKK